MRKILYLISFYFVLSLGFTACDSDDVLLDMSKQEALAKLEGEWVWEKATIGIPGSKEEEDVFSGRPPGEYITIFKNGTTASTVNDQPEEPKFYPFNLVEEETCWGAKTFSYWISNPAALTRAIYIIELTDDRLVTSTCSGKIVDTNYYTRRRPSEN